MVTEAIAAESGRDFARYRIVLGASVRQVAEALGVASTTISRWERGVSPLDSKLADDWIVALCQVAADRLLQLERLGWTAKELVGGDLGATLQTLTSPTAGSPAPSPDEAETKAEGDEEGRGQ